MNLQAFLLDGSTDTSASATIDTRFDHYYLKGIWDLLEPNLATIAVPAIYTLILNIRERSQVLTMFGYDLDEWDPDSLSRNTIGVNDEERFEKSLHILIDALRDSCLFVLENKLYDSPSLVAQLMEPAVPLLRRIAVFLTTNAGHWTPDQRIDWLLENISIDSYNEREELVNFIESNFPGSKDETRCKVLCAIDDITRNSVDSLDSIEYADRLRFQYLDLLRKAVPNYEPLETRWSELARIHPEWIRRQKASVETFLHPEKVEQVAPWNEKLLVSGAESEWLPTIINFVADKSPRRQEGRLVQVTRGAAINVVAETASNDPMWGLRLAASLLEAKAFDSFAWEALFRSWNFEVLDEHQILEIIGIAQTPSIHEKYPALAAKLLKELIVRRENDEEFDLSRLLNHADNLAQSIWLNAKDPNLSLDPENDWVLYAINSWSGNVVEYWIHSFSYLLRGEGERDDVIANYYAERFTEVTKRNDTIGGAGRAMLCGQARFLIWAIPQWTQENLIPLFSSSEDSKLRQAWHGLLARRAINNKLWEAISGPMTNLVSTLDRLEGPAMGPSHKEYKDQFLWLYAGCTCHYVPDPFVTWLPRLYQHTDKSSHARFAMWIESVLDQATTDERSAWWGRWIARHWINRIDNIPVPLSPDEAGMMMSWLLWFDDVFPDAVAIATRMPSINLQHNHLLHDLSESNLIDRFPDDVAKLLVYVLQQYSEPNHHSFYDIPKLLVNVPPKVRDRRLCEDLKEIAVRRGFSWPIEHHNSPGS